MTQIAPSDAPDPAPSAEPEGRVLRDAAETRRMPVLDAAGGSAARRKQVALLQRALKLGEDETKRALELTLKALAMDPDLPQARHMAGVLYDRLGRVSTALEHYEAAWKLDPGNAELLQSLGLCAWKLDMLEGAEKFFRLACAREPGKRETIVNLACVLRDQGRFDDAVELLRQAIYLDQSESLLWNALGSVLLESGDPFQAETFYREAIALDPDFARAWHNLAYALDLQGGLEAALDCYDSALRHAAAPQDIAQMRHGRAYSLLGAGRLEEGWDEYDVRTSPAYSGATVFLLPAPRWDRDPASLAGKRVVLVGEQGLGDEVLFLNAAGDMARAIGPDGKLLIACERRLVPLVGRAFPEAVVGPHHTIAAEARKLRAISWLDGAGGADLWAPMGDAVCAFRRTPDSFPERGGFLPADPERVAQMRAALDALGPGLKVGVVWKSLIMTPNRAKHFSAFQQWAPVLRTPGAVFVNLQYGAVDSELDQAQRDHGVTVHRIPGLDVRGDLDGVAALGAALDLTIGPMTASTNLAAAAGGECWILGDARQWIWLGTGRMPFYPQTTLISPDGWRKWDGAMRRTADMLSERIKANQAASAAA